MSDTPIGEPICGLGGNGIATLSLFGAHRTILLEVEQAEDYASIVLDPQRARQLAALLLEAAERYGERHRDPR